MLHGRADECATITDLLEGVRASRSGVLVLRGEPGVGKSALLDFAAQQAGDTPVLRASGVEAEVRLPFATLHQLLYPVLDRVDSLPAAQASALRAALGLASGGGADRFLVAVATLTLLAEVAADAGLLCLVDDAQWADSASIEAAAFAARRLEAEGVAMVFAARDTPAPGLAGLPELRLQGLPPDAAADLLAERFAPISGAVRDQLAARTGGLPLALLEVPALLDADVLSDRVPLPDPLPVGSTVQHLYTRRAEGLSDGARRLLLVTAADETGTLSTILQAAAPTADALREAELSGLVSIDGSSLRFRHPLMRSAIYAAATFADRQDAHRRVAAALDPDDPEQASRRAWHLAAASAAPDEAVAFALEQAAEDARQRSGSAGAAAALERAAALSEAPAERGRRLLAAAEAAWLAGQPQWSTRLLDQAERVALPGPAQARLLRQRGVVELRCGIPARAYELLMDSADAADAGRDVLDTLVLAGEAAAAAANPDWTIAVGARAAAVTPADETEAAMARLLRGAAAILEGDPAQAAVLLETVVERAGAVNDPAQLLWAGRAALYLGDEVTAQAVYGRAIERARATGAVGLLISLLNRVAMSAAIAGRPTEAVANASEGRRLASETGLEADSGIALFALALAHAVRGEESPCRRHASQAQALAETRRLAMIADGARWSIGLLELGVGRPAAALARLQTPLDVGNDRYPMRFLDTADLVEAAVRAGQPDACRSQLDAFEAWAVSGGVPARLALLSRCRGLLADPEGAPAHYETALRLHGESTDTYQRARTLLLYGEALRRRKQRSAARPHLRAALAMFERLGAGPWAERARHELRASGETARRRDPSTLDQLTPQELQIARLAGAGESNRDIAAQLFLSPRTVEYHLHKVFTKLGVTARGQLTRLDLAGVA